MSGLLTVGYPQRTGWTGAEQFPLDTLNAQGISPETAMTSLLALAAAISFFSNSLSETTVAGSRYFSSYNVVGAPTTFTGISALIGATGGTDKFIYELHDSNGNLVATTALAGVTVGTAGSWQQIPFTAPVTVQPGTYFLVVQSNGTTAKIGAYNAPGLSILTGSATGTFGTSAAITPPTTYTAGVGPIALLY